MAAHVQSDSRLALPTIGEQHETELSLESDVDHKTWKPDGKVKMALAVQTFCVFIISLDMTILTATLPAVAQALHATAIESFWIAASYLLANAVCQPTMAALADIFGRQPMFFGSVLLFTIGSIVCATAPTVPAMLAGRTIQGVGGGGILSVNLIILSDLVPLLQRPKYQGYIQLVFSIGTFVAPIIGGLMIRTEWRWVFYINLPFCTIGLVSVPIWLRYEKRGPTHYTKVVLTRARRTSSGVAGHGNVAPAGVTVGDQPSVVSPGESTVLGSVAPQNATTGDHSSEADREKFILRGGTAPGELTIGAKVSSVDWVGSILMIVCSTSFLVGLSWGGNQYQWQSPAVLIPIIIGLAGIVFTVFYEKRFARDPFLRLAIFQHWSGIVVSICTVVQGYLLFAMTYYLIVYLMACKLYSPVLAGTGLLPFVVTVVPVSALTGPAITRLGRYRWAIWLGWSVSVLGLGLLVVLGVGTHPAVWVIIFICAGAGQGLLLIGHSVAIQASCGADDAAHAISMYSFMRSFGLCLGVIVGGTVFQNFLRMRLARDGLPGIAAEFEGFIPTLQRMGDEDPMKLELQQAYAWAVDMLFATSAGIGFVGLLLSLTTGDFPLNTAFRPKHRLRR